MSTGHVYLAEGETTGHVKVGYSADPVRRVHLVVTTKEGGVMPIEIIDADALVCWLDDRRDAQSRGDEAMAMYWAGRIDGHCLQNAIGDSELRELAERRGRRVDWDTAMAIVED